MKKLFSKRLWPQRFAGRELHKHPFAIPAAAFLLLLLVLGIGFLILRDKPVAVSNGNVVILSHDKKREVLPTKADTVGELLAKVGITLNEGDVVEPSQDTPIREDNFRVNVYRARPVMIIDGGQKMFALSAATTARSIAAQAGTQVYPEDRVSSEAQTDFLSDGAIGQKIVIARAKPTYLNLYGTQVTVRTHAKTVGELLREKNIQLAKDDTLQPAADTALTPQTLVFVTRNGIKVTTAEEPIAMQTETVDDPSLSFGTTAVRQKGAPGKKLVTYQIGLVNGKETRRDVIQTVVVEQPVKQIIARGRAVSIPADHEAIMAAAGVVRSDYPYVEYIIGHENALWCPTRWQGQNSCPPYYQEKFAGAESAGVGYGLCQSTPAIKMASAGSDWRTNAVTQLKWCAGYARSRYGSWSAAYEHWISHHNW